LERLCFEGTSGPADLRPKSFDVLRYLVEHHGRVVSKEELIRAIWPNLSVSDESLTQCITEVRRALGDDNKRIIKTIPRRGYLVDVAVSAVGSLPSHPCQATQPTRRTDSRPSGDLNAIHLTHVLEERTKPTSMSHANLVRSVEKAVESDTFTVLRVLTAALKSTKQIVQRFDARSRAAKRSGMRVIIAGISALLIAFTLHASFFQSVQSFEGTWRGEIHCDKLPVTSGPLIAPIVVSVAGLSATYSRKVLGPDGNTIIGIEDGFGTITSSGTINLVGSMTLFENYPRFSHTASYAGMASGQTAELHGTQEWKLGNSAYLTRNCSISIKR
jgi:DNA-binding winged helix-turn-helix (wHTH) protein